MPTFITTFSLTLCLAVLAGCATTEGQSPASDCRRLAEENRQLRESLTGATRTLQASQAGFKELDASLKSSAKMIASLRQELELYRTIIAPRDGKSGLRIYGMEIVPASTATVYSYKLTLIQSMRHDAPFRGTVAFRIVGQQDGRKVTLQVPSGNERLKQVSVKYFQEIGGRLELPRGFRPHSVVISVAALNGTPVLERTFEWPAA